ncbi:hypothetical protein ACFOGG_19090 [Brenneria rubrifaciens]|uniref:hypothetical protein n=1 Tax=Brenneria rubrifaciens TaxID=55213 RepID=UPI00361DC0BC
MDHNHGFGHAIHSPFSRSERRISAMVNGSISLPGGVLRSVFHHASSLTNTFS